MIENNMDRIATIRDNLRLFDRCYDARVWVRDRFGERDITDQSKARLLQQIRSLEFVNELL
jgi:hypothetical protein